ncbi:triosephosphate isomerase (TIM) [Saccharopolyspora antimicrobica]|uniref:Triosephosphate isomerase n=2 Tax=Saccharopolyspora TaxID=1835 RepID=A0A1I5E650_9PSEU|nr:MULTISPECIES: triose-phosphate isomerase [Saccharopolyspora]RKT86682.1 triosephosphate isomerase [Saccharopolyspora antimicrobica]SEF67156.1 triosephosphate isomerase [Saccharopolyspora kobensis]SFC41513.1 triosephosphate isomerase [Saccharopolyspora kobensis]SFO06907.1 triosephosphate isomerase (TIM) [Saccharopolyspora antimicrobica]
MARTPLIAGNWKMNLNHLEAIALVQKVAFALPEKYFAKVEVAVLPPFTDIRSVQTLVDGDKLLLKYGAQDISAHESGAYTGEVSGPMLAKLGCTYVVVGHSERREYHGETDELVNKKVRAALKNGLSPILCVGEQLEVREAGGHVEHCTTQLINALKGLKTEQVREVVVAYEPVWAIGTGKVATAADAQEVCAAIRAALAEKYGKEIADEVRVLYGGSVKSSNIGDLVGQSDVDGALVGGASLNGDEFAKLSAMAAGGPLP